MKKLFAIVVVLAALAVAVPMFAKTQTLAGTVTDTMCSQKHMMPGMSDADCVRECAKAGSKYALVVGDKVYTLEGDAKLFEKHAGHKVSVTGTVNGTTITVASLKMSPK